MTQEARKSWEQFLSPEITRDRLISASIFITTYELLKDSIVERIRNFYSVGIDDGNSITSPTYKANVLALGKNVLSASLAWLEECAVINRDDLDAFVRITTLRNKLAHELPSFVMSGTELEIAPLFEEAFSLLRKIEIWWVINLDIATDPTYNGEEIDERKIVPGPILMLQLMLDVINGNLGHLETYKAAGSK